MDSVLESDLSVDRLRLQRESLQRLKTQLCSQLQQLQEKDILLLQMSREIESIKGWRQRSQALQQDARRLQYELNLQRQCREQSVVALQKQLQKGLQKKFFQASQKLERAKGQIGIQEIAINKLNETCRSLRNVHNQEEDNHITQVKRLQIELRDLSDRLKFKDCQNKQLKKINDSMASDLQKTQTEVRRLLQSVRESDINRDELLLKIGQKDRDLRDLNKTMDEERLNFKKKEAALVLQIEKTAIQNQKLYSLCNESNLRLETFQAMTGQLDCHLQQALQAKDSIASQLKRVKSQFQIADRHNLQLTTDNKSLKSKIQCLQKQIKKMQQNKAAQDRERSHLLQLRLLTESQKKAQIDRVSELLLEIKDCSQSSHRSLHK